MQTINDVSTNDVQGDADGGSSSSRHPAVEVEVEIPGLVSLRDQHHQQSSVDSSSPISRNNKPPEPLLPSAPYRIHQAVNSRNVAEVRRAVREGWDINEREAHGNTPLHIAAYEGWIEGVQVLLKLGAKTNIANLVGDTPWHLAAQQNDEPMCQFLVEYTSDKLGNPDPDDQMFSIPENPKPTFLVTSPRNNIKRAGTPYPKHQFPHSFTTASGFGDGAEAAVGSCTEHLSPLLIEFIGTFFVCFTLGVTPHLPGLTPELGPYLAMGAMHMTMVFMGEHISGAHYNPATTLAVAAAGHLRERRGFRLPTVVMFLLYILAQVAGAFAAAALAHHLAPLGLRAVSVPDGKAVDLSGRLWTSGAEAILAFAYTLVVLNVSYAHANTGKSFHGLAIGAALFATTYINAPIAGGFLNPAIDTVLPVTRCMLDGDCQLDNMWVFCAGPAVGALAAALCFALSGSRTMLGHV